MKIYNISVCCRFLQHGTATHTSQQNMCLVLTKSRAHWSHKHQHSNTPLTAVRPSTETTRDRSYQQPQGTGEGIKHVK
jgi:hypothetical protein